MTKSSFRTLGLSMLPFIALIIPFSTLGAQSKDDNVIIKTGSEQYDFEQKDGKIHVTKNSDITYQAIRKSDLIYVAEFYDCQSEIKDADVDGYRTSPIYHHAGSDEIFYSDSKVCYFELAFKQKDKEIAVQFKKIIKDPRYLAQIYLSEPYFTRSKSVTITIPAWLDIEIIEKNMSDAIRKNVYKIKDNTVYSYEITNLQAQKSESNMPGPSYIYPHLLFRAKSAKLKKDTINYFNTLDDQYKWYKQLVAELQTDTAVIKAKSDELVKNCKSDMEKISHIFNWVKENIRYIAFENGIMAYKPDEAQEVLRKKYGDCKGMANLTCRLMQAQGFDARLSWLGTSHLNYDYSTPSLAVDNHMICTLMYNGKPIYLDATAQYMQAGEYYQSIQGRQILIENGEKYLLERIPGFGPEFNTDSISYSYQIKDNKLVGKANNSFSGESKLKILNYYYNTAADRRNLMLNSYYIKSEATDKATGFDLSKFNNEQKTPSLSFDIEIRSTIQQIGNEIYFSPDINESFIDMKIDTTKRVNDFLFSYKHHIVNQASIEVPQEYKINSLPANFTIDNPNYTFSIVYSATGNKITYKKTLTIKNLLIRKNEFNQWNTDLNHFKKAFTEQIVLTKK